MYSLSYAFPTNHSHFLFLDMSWLILNVGGQYPDEYSLGFPGASDGKEYTYT